MAACRITRAMSYNNKSQGSPITEPAMTQITIPAQVVNGHLQHEKLPAELEGQHVLVTLTVVQEEMPPEPEYVWSENYSRAKKAVEQFTSGTDSHPIEPARVLRHNMVKGAEHEF
jgi:hypothetical protein